MKRSSVSKLLLVGLIGECTQEKNLISSAIVGKVSGVTRISLSIQKMIEKKKLVSVQCVGRPIAALLV